MRDMTESKIPNVSVCIPVYNNSELITETLESILKQTYRDFEVIILDDGSSNNMKTWKTISSYGPPIYSFRIEKNIGISGARNYTVEKARGEYIAFCDSDNLWMPTKLEEQLEYFKNPNIGFVASSVKTFGGRKDRIIPDSKLPISKDLFTEYLKENLKIYPSTLIFHKTIFKKINGWDTSIPTCEDFVFFFKSNLYNSRNIYKETAC